MNKTQLKMKVIELSKTLKCNELYDYIIAQYYASNRVSKGYVSVKDIEDVTGLKIKDVATMNKLLCYWTKFLTHEERVQKVVNILNFVNVLSQKDRDEVLKQSREKDALLTNTYNELEEMFNTAKL